MSNDGFSVWVGAFPFVVLSLRLLQIGLEWMPAFDQGMMSIVVSVVIDPVKIFTSDEERAKAELSLNHQLQQPHILQAMATIEEAKHPSVFVSGVRIVVLKGRQQGCSTYTEGRFYWLVSNRKGLRAYILTHEADATANLFDMVQRYHNNQPPFTQRDLKNKSSKLLEFCHDSVYRVGTAGNKGAGRSSTAQLFHGSEVAFWPNADEHLAGVLQAVPNENNTEVILESTANGVGGVFYDCVMDADAGRGDFEQVFIPWFWQDEYRSEVPADFTTDADERYLKQQYDPDDQQGIRL